MNIEQLFRTAFDAVARRQKRTGPDLPDEIPFTYPAHGNAPQSGTRRERRAAGVKVELVTDQAYPIDYLIGARARRRQQDRDRDRRQRKGNRKFQQAQLDRAFSDDTKRAQLRVLEAGPEHPMHASVAHDLRVKYADELRAQGAL